MTKIQRFLPSNGARSRPVLFVAVPGAQLLDLVGPMEAFDVCNRLLAEKGERSFYQLELAGLNSLVKTASGMKVHATRLDRVRLQPHTLVVGGSLELIDTRVPKALVRHLQTVAEKAQRVVSICTGAFVLGELGLLDGKRCTTHWLALAKLRERYPHARVETDALYTQSGRVYTSAGVTSGLDLALHLIERDLGAAMALAVARLLVVYLHRPGGQSQFSVPLRVQSSASQRIRKAVAAVVRDPGGDHAVESLARRAAMSPRHFARVFATETQARPAAFVEQVRCDSARAALEMSDATVEAIAADCGFGTDETMRRVFKRLLGVSPREYRQRFHQ